MDEGYLREYYQDLKEDVNELRVLIESYNDLIDFERECYIRELRIKNEVIHNLEIVLK